jgi:hypothetical protein
MEHGQSSLPALKHWLFRIQALQGNSMQSQNTHVRRRTHHTDYIAPVGRRPILGS